MTCTLEENYDDRTKTGSLGAAYRELQRFEEAIVCFQQARAIGQEIDDQKNKGWILYNLGDTYRVLGRFEEAIDYFQQALTISRENNFPRLEGHNLCCLGDVFRDTGQLGTAQRYWNQALAILKDHDDPLAVEVRARLENLHAKNGDQEPYSQALVVGLEEGQGDDGPDDAGEFVEWSSVASGENFPVLEV